MLQRKLFIRIPKDMIIIITYGVMIEKQFVTVFFFFYCSAHITKRMSLSTSMQLHKCV